MNSLTQQMKKKNIAIKNILKELLNIKLHYFIIFLNHL